MNARLKEMIRSCFKNRLAETLLIMLYKRRRKFRSWVPKEGAYPAKAYRFVERDDVLYKLDISDVIGHSLFFFNHYFAPLEVFNLLKDDSTVIDIGANIGTVALRAAKTCQRGHVYAFEPDPAHIKSLRANHQLNQFSNITIIPKGLGSKPGQALLSKLEQRNAGMNRILPAEQAAQYDSTHINVATLDDEMSSISPTRIDLIKIDVEGYEFHVLMGAQKTIARYRPILVIEVIDANLQVHLLSSTDVIDLLQNWDYEIMDLKTHQPIVAGAKIETDILCTPQKTH
jgi:FkbM family methyltransferase